MLKKNRGSGTGEGIVFVLVIAALVVAVGFYQWAKSWGVDVDVLFRSTVITLIILACYFWYLFKFEFRNFLAVTSGCAALAWPFWWPVLINKCNKSAVSNLWGEQECSEWYASFWFLGGSELVLIALAIWLYRKADGYGRW